VHFHALTLFCSDSVTSHEGESLVETEAQRQKADAVESAMKALSERSAKGS
jgi:hypothetical protein